MILFCSPIGLHYLCNNEKDRFHPNRQRGALRPRDGHSLLCGSLCHNQPLDKELTAAGWPGLSTVLVNLLLYPKIKTVDMNDSLKTLD